jgi:hypothetical protein
LGFSPIVLVLVVVLVLEVDVFGSEHINPVGPYD